MFAAPAGANAPPVATTRLFRPPQSTPARRRSVPQWINDDTKGHPHDSYDCRYQQSPSYPWGATVEIPSP
ncbi:hypothetical protein GCM10010276_18270 [Streptomyces longisporus]|uniref:Uncharacterized protein n=1 Tax=Streptomyces longisporus TaxID=1948 RepID=A0ABP5YI79_STRLO